MSPKHAADLCEAHEIDFLLGDEEEVRFMEAQNPELLDAYRALRQLADQLK